MKNYFLSYIKIFSILGVVFIAASIISFWVISEGIRKTVKNQALFIAEAVATQAKTARSVYATAVASKLKQDGTGPHIDYLTKTGYVPIPAQFLKLVGLKTSELTHELYSYKPVSKWNLESSQGLSDPFLLWAWPSLEAQDEKQPTAPIQWKAVYRFEGQGDEQVLRYLYPDPASQLSCVSCHNRYEEKSYIISRRQQQGVMPHKQWQQHQLLGALSVTIPLNRIKYITDDQVQETTLLIFSILITSFIALAFLHLRMSNKERLIVKTESQMTLLKQQRANAARLKHMSTHDALTGLPNRALLLEHLKKIITLDRDQEHLAAILFIDLDQFKVINDSLGHDVGDQLLIEVGRRLRSCVRKGDTVARQGGDEFIILLPSIQNIKQVDRVGAKLVDTLKQPYHVLHHEMHISASIGITLFPDDGTDVDTLLKNSDITMYQVKANGRNNYQFFTPEMHASIEKKHQLIIDLRKDVGSQNFELHYQPIVDINTGAIVRLEVLMRWHNTHYGLVSPTEFIPLAEETGLIIPLGDWLLKQACLQLKKWQDQGHLIKKLSINLSVRQFQRPEFTDELRCIFHNTNVDPTMIELEITEGVLMENTPDVVDRLNALRSMGVSISIDDFGTGYSSLSYLKSFPITTLKIDHSFIKGIQTDKDSLTITKTIITLAHSLGMDTVAEGVENSDQLSILRELKCNFYQGYCFCIPLNASDLIEFIQNNP
ncbi:MAG: diguanylate cyclase (GGDEF)-like protein [Candidatus Endobugula sp.]